MITTADTDAPLQSKRQWIYPLIRKGKFYNYRSWLSYVYLVLFFSGPFLRINEQPLLLLNVLERRFVLLGQVFWPQDFFLFVLAILTFIVCIVLFTIAFGRIFCGWICPQTIFMEMVFRKLEGWVEGDARKRKKLDDGPWTMEKHWKKTAKHALFLILSFLIANFFLAYVIGSEALMNIITQPVQLHWVGFGSICLFTLVFYLVYSQARELVCTVICPYGRLQGVLADKHTLMVAYNYLRGEPRGKIDKKIVAHQGDCVDCSLCIDVCPTGIDIRKGTQIECINCTACIDVCNDVMHKTGRELNLIGFYSEEQIKGNKKPKFTGRMMAYSAVICVLLGVLTFFVLQRSAVDVTIMRATGLLYQEQPGGYISNLYNADLINKTDKVQRVEIVPADTAIKVEYVQQPGAIEKNGSAKLVFFVNVPAIRIHQSKTEIKLNILTGNRIISTVRTNFIGPVN